MSVPNDTCASDTNNACASDTSDACASDSSPENQSKHAKQKFYATGCETGICNIYYRAINFSSCADSTNISSNSLLWSGENKPLQLVQRFSNLAPTSKLCNYSLGLTVDPWVNRSSSRNVPSPDECLEVLTPSVSQFMKLQTLMFTSFIVALGLLEFWRITGHEGPHAATGVLVSLWWFSGLHPAPGPDGSRCLHGWVSVTHTLSI